MSEFFENEADEASSSEQGDDSDVERVRSRPLKEKKKKKQTKKVASSDEEDDGQSSDNYLSLLVDVLYLCVYALKGQALCKVDQDPYEI